MATNYSNDDSKGGYLARFQEKLENKPAVKKYTIKDYRNLKKEIEIKAAKDTGKLGFDPQNENYQQKARIEAQKREYAEKVKERNRLLIANKQTESPQPSNSRSTQNNTQNRPRSISPLEPHENEANIEGKILVRVRDPVTGIIKKLYINDSKQKVLKEKHDMNKVHSFVGHTSRVSVRSDVAQSSNILNEFYQQEHVKIFKDNADYVDFMSREDGVSEANNGVIDAGTNTEEERNSELESNTGKISGDINTAADVTELKTVNVKNEDGEKVASQQYQSKEISGEITTEPSSETKKEKFSFFSKKKK